MKYYAVIDTNVLISAILKYQSIPGNILELAMEGTIIPLLNTNIVSEYKDVMSRPKFGLPEDIVSDIITSLENTGIYVDTGFDSFVDVDFPDLKDLVFYKVLIEKRKQANSYLVTGNIKHFPNEPFIVTPRECTFVNDVRPNLKRNFSSERCNLNYSIYEVEAEEERSGTEASTVDYSADLKISAHF